MPSTLYFNKKRIYKAISFIGIFVLFIAVTIFANTYQDQLQSAMQNNVIAGMFVYVFLTATAIVVAPVSTLPLIPVATTTWGWIIAGTLTMTGWVLGSQIAFFLARKYGKKRIQKFVSLKQLSQFEHSLPEHNIFWFIVLLRLTIPVDILSYALGLFSSISYKMYFFATLLGVIPFAFVFAYAGGLPPHLQIISLLTISLLVITLYIVRKRSMRF